MLVPLSWLKDYVDIDVSVDELEDKLAREGRQMLHETVTADEIEKIMEERGK